jgi:phosphoribosyl 1,2-cyclic phosphodiesterase
MQTLHLQGGFGEKGRTSVLVDDGDTRLMLDVGIKVGAAKGSYHPVLARPAAEIDALFVTHAHEDHIGALCWLVAQGFVGPVFLTKTTQDEMMATLAQYAQAAHLATFNPAQARFEVFCPGDQLSIGAHHVTTGHSGHVAGGVWFGVQSGAKRMVYCGDVVPDSAVLPMTTLPECDVMILDCSYGDDRVPVAQRARSILDWVARHAQGCVLPTPLSGRSLELLAILPGEIAIAQDMYAPLCAQLDDETMLRPGTAGRLRARLGTTLRWVPGDALLPCPLLVHDGMGVSGPAASALAQAEDGGHPVLLTGHLPDGSPGLRMRDAGRADWLRLPTHPTLDQNTAIWETTGRPRLLGHSCDASALLALQGSLSALDISARTGQSITV